MYFCLHLATMSFSRSQASSRVLQPRNWWTNSLIFHTDHFFSSLIAIDLGWATNSRSLVSINPTCLISSSTLGFWRSFTVLTHLRSKKSLPYSAASISNLESPILIKFSTVRLSTALSSSLKLSVFHFWGLPGYISSYLARAETIPTLNASMTL